MDEVLEGLTIVSAGPFAGGALYVSIAEHPGRMEAGITAALAEFRPSYLRAAPWQALLAIITFVCGLLSRSVNRTGFGRLAGASWGSRYPSR